MAQKPLFKSGKKKGAKPPAANRHGKVQKVAKGNLQRPAKQLAKRLAEKQDNEITKAIKQRIEETAAAAAQGDGLKLSTVRPGKEAAQGATKKKAKGQPKR